MQWNFSQKKRKKKQNFSKKNYTTLAQLLINSIPPIFAKFITKRAISVYGPDRNEEIAIEINYLATRKPTLTFDFLWSITSRATTTSEVREWVCAEFYWALKFTLVLFTCSRRSSVAFSVRYSRRDKVSLVSNAPFDGGETPIPANRTAASYPLRFANNSHDSIPTKIIPRSSIFPSVRLVSTISIQPSLSSTPRRDIPYLHLLPPPRFRALVDPSILVVHPSLPSLISPNSPSLRSHVRERSRPT